MTTELQLTALTRQQKNKTGYKAHWEAGKEIERLRASLSGKSKGRGKTHGNKRKEDTEAKREIKGTKGKWGDERRMLFPA